MATPVIAGPITADGVLEVLAEIESRRTSGILHFKGKEREGEIVLVAGQMAVDQKALDDGDDPVEAFLALREGEYSVHQRLPVLPVSKGDDHSRRGSLAVHVPADLMNYCERAGLTGTLQLSQDDRKAEVVYDRGALIAIRVDGSEDDDLHEVFSWEDGKFVITASPEVPLLDIEELPEEEDPVEREPTLPRIRRDDTGQNFLKVVEVALTSILEEREKRRSPTRTSPPLPPAPKARKSDRAPGKRKDPTVKVIYLGDGPATSRSDPETRHLKGRAGADHELPEAVPERRSEEKMSKKKGKKKKSRGTQKKRPERKVTESSEASTKAKTQTEAPGREDERTSQANPEPAPSMVQTVGWVALLVVVFFLALGILAQLPPL
ncbi:MAG: hypothetical protein AAGF12_27995 [Myxococcota bacterium]